MTDEFKRDAHEPTAPPELVRPFTKATRAAASAVSVTWVNSDQLADAPDSTAVMPVIPRGDETSVLIPVQRQSAPKAAPPTEWPAKAPVQREPAKSAPRIPAQPKKAQPRRAAEPDQPTALVPATEAPAALVPAALVPAQRRDDTILLPVLPRVDDTVVLPVIPAAPGPQPARLRWASWSQALGRAPDVLALSALGVAVVALGYVAGRTGAGWATPAYWLGQFLVFCPIVARLLSRRLAGTAESLTLVIGLAVNQYLTKVFYSPDQLRFPDELQHWTATVTLMNTGKLFTPNWALPVAVHFPGVEELGAAFSSMTGLPVMTAALVVGGVAHLAFIALLFAVVRRTTGSAALAGLTCAIYSTALHYLFFDSMYIYQTAALPFLMLAIWATAAWQQGRSGQKHFSYPLIALVGIAAVTASHHVTAMVTVGTLILFAVCDVLFERPRRFRVVPIAGGAALIMVIWFAFVAKDIVSYLGPPADNMITAINGMIHGTSKSSSSSSTGSAPSELAIEALGLLALGLVFLRAIPTTLRATSHRAWRFAALIGSAAFFASTVVRFVGADGPEIAGRASTFAYLPISVLAAIALVNRSRVPATTGVRGQFPVSRRWQVATGVALTALLMVGARLGGWPPKYERLPGGYALGSYERSVNPVSVSAATWTGEWLGTSWRFAADSDGLTLVSTYGRENPVNQAAQLYYDKSWGLVDQNIQQKQAVDFIWVDLRLSQLLPVSGSYFPNDPQANKHIAPIPLANLQKFDGILDASRSYDNGTIIIYDVRNA